MNKGIRLWLDDNRPAPTGWTWVRNVEDAKVKLFLGDVEELSLDYDLDNPECQTCQFRCGHRDEGKCDKTCGCHSNGDQNGLALVKWMIYTARWPARKPVVHSTSGEGAEKMKLLIDENWPG